MIIVQCGQCKHQKTYDCPMCYSGKQIDDDWFCGDGEPKEEVKTAQAETEGDGRATWWYVCGECHTAIDTKDRFCRECGRRIIW